MANLPVNITTLQVDPSASVSAAGRPQMDVGTLPVPQPQPATWDPAPVTSAANAAVTITQPAAGAGVRNYLSALTVSWSGGAPAAGTNVQVTDGATVLWDFYLGAAGAAQGSIHLTFPLPLRGSPNTALNVTVAAGGVGVTTKAAIAGTTGA